MIQWPATLPLPMIEASGAPRHPSITSTLESPIIQRRRRYSSSTVQLQANWVLNILQMDAFEAFFETDLSNGAAVFEMELRYPETSEVKLWVVRFVGGYSQAYEPKVWHIDAQLELIRPPLAPGAPSLGYQPFYVASEDESDVWIPFEHPDNTHYSITE